MHTVYVHKQNLQKHIKPLFPLLSEVHLKQNDIPSDPHQYRSIESEQIMRIESKPL
jgi:hypothetical protein